MTNKLLRIGLVVAGMLLIASCGNRKAPTGGKKDTIPPAILAIQPDEFGDIYDGKIVITFSKPIQRNTILTGLYIQPPILRKKFKWDGSQLTIGIYEELERQTNYYLSLTPEIKGEHDNNLDANYTYVFRSGRLQENVISGSIAYEDAEDMGKKITCKLMTADSTLIYTSTLVGTAYRFENLNFQDHIIEAFIDKNQNQRYNPESEPYFRGITEAREFSTLPMELTYIDTLAPTCTEVKTISNRELQLTFSEALASLDSIGLSTRDSVPDSVIVQCFVLHGNQVRLITSTPLDTLNYIVHVHGSKDLKENLRIYNKLPVKGIALPDTVGPKLISIQPREGATISTLLPEIVAEFDEIIPRDSLQVILAETETGKAVAVNILDSPWDAVKLQPAKPLKNYTSYRLTLWVKDSMGNRIKDAVTTLFIPLSR